MNNDFVFEDEGFNSFVPPPKSQSPWEFAGYSETVANEHARKNTTSVDHKISKLRSRINKPDEEDDEKDTIPLKNGPLTDEQEGKDVRVKETGRWEGEDDDEDSDIETLDDMKTLLASKTHAKPYKENIQSKVAEPGSHKKGSGGFFASSEGASFSANSFAELNLSRPLLRACESLGYQKPTPIQAACIPLALTGRDICGSAITGSGKTAAFGLPIMERLIFRPKRISAIRVLILTPTRELAVQVHSMLENLAQFTDIRCCLVVGGLSIKVQEAALRTRPDVVVATPGRMIDHLHNAQSVGLEELAVLILDEADRLLELGFSNEVQELVKLCPRRRQTMLFSATMTEEVNELIKLSLTSPVRLSADPSTKRPSKLVEEVIKIRRNHEAKREAILLALCSRNFPSKVIVFSGTKQAAHRLKILFGLSGLKAAELHGDLTQAQRLDALELFRKQEVDFLIATDVAARGLDIIGVQTVINFACPRDITSYVHRVGRTARAGREGCAITFVTECDRRLLKDMAKRAGSRLLSRVVAEQPIAKWFQNIEEMEEHVAVIIEEEREERALRKAEMEANKAQNMMEHKDEIYSCPKRIWFESERDKKLLAKESKAPTNEEASTGKIVTSLEDAEDMKRKEKRQREREKNLPRKKRRKLEASRAMLEEKDPNNSEEEKGSKKGRGQKAGLSLVEVAYRRAKAVKAAEKAREAGKFVKKNPSTKKTPRREKGRKEEMKELFQNEMNAKKQTRTTSGGSQLGGAKKKPNKAFKSKSRYKRRK